MLESVAQNASCGLTRMRVSVFYMRTWLCPTLFYYFNISTNLCQDECADTHNENTTSYECIELPCQTSCTNCSITYNATTNISHTECISCDYSLGYVLDTGHCVCEVGFSYSGSSCDEICGDGRLSFMGCDDGNTNNGDGCDENCTVESGYVCTGGTTTTASSCSQPVEVCGDGVLVSAQCDDNNTVGGDGCSASCTLETGWNCSNGSTTSPSVCWEICGDGIVVSAACDDGNTANGDGCSSTCTVETGFSCVNGSISTPSSCFEECGDGIVVSAACDDGNGVNGDGCDSTCAVESGWACSGGNLTTASSCSEVCGDGLVFVLACDDNNTANGDGCD